MKKIILGNWKMNPENSQKAEELFSEVKKSCSGLEVEVSVIPPTIYIPLLKDRGISLGVQNIYYQKEGAFTGEISAQMIKNSGCKYCLVGHSERRNIFGEDNSLVNKKIKSLLEVKIIPILCIGETEDEKNNGQTTKVVKNQLEECLKDREPKEIIIAYEPVWAIGSGNPCNPETAFKMRLLIKKTISEIYDRDFADRTPIIYGGSVKLENAKSYIEESKFNGLLVGGASLNPREFSKIVSEIQ